MTLDETLIQIRSRPLLLTGEAQLWHPNQHVTQDVTQAVKRHRRALLALLVLADVRVCPNPGLHRKYWRYAGAGLFVCDKCQELLPCLF